MSHRQRMPQMGSRKWSRIAHHKGTHFRKKYRADVLKRMDWIDRWLHIHAAKNPRWRV